MLLSLYLVISQVETVTALVDKASNASDRWLFLFLLALLLAGGLFIIKYLVKALESQQTIHSEFVQKVYTEGVKVQAQLVVALQENNQLAQRIKTILDRFDQEHDREVERERRS